MTRAFGRGALVIAAAITMILTFGVAANATPRHPARVSGSDDQATVSVSPRATDERCTTVPSGTDDVCVNKTDGRVFGVIYGLDISDLTQVVYQCDGFGHNCGAFIASHGNPTSSKPVSFGHTYRNCASFTDVEGNRWVFKCSPYVTGN
jgi:hypothetical protein